MNNAPLSSRPAVQPIVTSSGQSASYTAPVTAADLSLPPLVRLFLIGTLALFLGCLLTEYLCVHVFHLPQTPYNRMTLVRSDDYADILMFEQRFRLFHKGNFFDPSSDLGNRFLYPAGAAPIYKIYYRVAGGPNERYFLAFITGVCSLTAGVFMAVLQRRRVAFASALAFAVISLVCSYPAFFVFNRANIEIVVWLFCVLGLWSMVKNRPVLAGCLFGLAGAIKIYPLIYLGLLLSRRKFLAVLAGIGTAAVATLVSLWGLDPNLRTAIAGVRAGNLEFAGAYIYQRRPTEIGLDHSLVGFVKQCLPHMPSPEAMQNGVHIYLITAALLGIVLYFVRIRSLPLINQVLCLSVASILLPPVSFDYTLMHLYLSWALFVLLLVRRYGQHLPPPPMAAALVVGFLICLSPENEFIYHATRFGGQIKAVALLGMFVLGLVTPFPSEFDTVPGPQRLA